MRPFGRDAPRARAQGPRPPHTGAIGSVRARLRLVPAGRPAYARGVKPRIQKSAAAWAAELSEEQYRVARAGGTERPFSGQYWNETKPGTYLCVCCKTPLFRSDAKFEAGCGWPSFFEPLEGANLVELSDTSLGMVRTEVRCATCDAHLGHLFPDGPPPTGLRYCINSVCLAHEPE